MSDNILYRYLLGRYLHNSWPRGLDQPGNHVEIIIFNNPIHMRIDKI